MWNIYHQKTETEILPWIPPPILTCSVKLFCQFSYQNNQIVLFPIKRYVLGHFVAVCDQNAFKIDMRIMLKKNLQGIVPLETHVKCIMSQLYLRKSSILYHVVFLEHIISFWN